MILALGILTLISQVVLLRELGTLFKGNELVLGLLLFSWLVGSGLGSALYRKLPEKWKTKPELAPALLFFASAALTVIVFLARFAFAWFQYRPMPNLFVLSSLSFGLILPVSLPLGLAFAALAARWSASRGFPWVYLWESLGACLGGLLFTFIISGRLDSFVVALFLCLAFVPNLVVRAAWTWRRKILAGIVIPLFLASGLGVFAEQTAGWTRLLQYRNSRLLAAGESRFGSIGLVDNQGLLSAYYNGAALFHSNPADYEEAALLPSLVSSRPRRILVLGFCPPPLLRELDKLQPEKITVISLDERLAGLVQDFEPVSPLSLVQYVFKDPVLWRPSASERYDLIWLAAGPPSSMADNRFFTPEFYSAVKEGLSPAGVFSLAWPYEENLVSGSTLMNLKILRNTLQAVFASVGTLAAGQFFFFASENPLNADLRETSRRLKGLEFPTRFVNQAYLDHYLDPARRSRFDSLLDGCPENSVNRFFEMNLYWNNLKNWFGVNLGDSWVFLVVLGVLLLAALVRNFRKASGWFLADSHSWFLFSLGFAFMLAEIQFLQFYQAVSGMVYGFFGLLTASFMLGLAIGARLASGNLLVRRSWDLAALAWVGGMGACFLDPPGFVFHPGLLNPAALAWNLAGGIVLSAVFNSEACWLADRKIPGEVLSAHLYAFDLFGSALAALLTPLALVPLLGQAGASVLGMALLLAAMFITRRPRYEA